MTKLKNEKATWTSIDYCKNEKAIWTGRAELCQILLCSSSDRLLNEPKTQPQAWLICK